jgi:AraC-like DNA-binding protein
MRYFLMSFFILNALFLIITHVIPYSYLVKLVKPVMAVLFSLLFPMVVWHLIIGVTASMLWFIVVPLFLYIVLPNARIVRWVSWCGVLMLLAMGIGYALWRFSDDVRLIPQTCYAYQMRVIFPNLLNIVAAFLFASHSLIYISRFSEMKIHGTENGEKTLNPQKNGEQEPSKFERIYGKIVRHMESTQPYLNSDFKIGELSGKLNVNTAYIGKAIFSYRNMNFNDFVNSYRVAHAKKLIQDNTQYTLEYVFQSSGFKNQSSFNRTFKALEGTTPSEYRVSLLSQSQPQK